jgi:hypothetical protein
VASIVDQETDARFWAQTNYKPGQKLDPKNPQDAKMIPVWIDLRAKVNREFREGTLITTFDHPVVAQNIADARVADEVTAAHLDAAVKAPDPATAQQHVEAAATAADVSTQKTQEAAAVQPPSVSPQVAKEAAQDVAQTPPPPHAPAKEHVAHAQARAAHKPTPRGVLDRETDARFWSQTHYKPGQKLDPWDPQDAKMAKVWLDIFQKVKREDAAGRLVLTYNHPVVAQNIADAQVADQVAAAHLDAAASAPDAGTSQQNAAAAATAAQVSAQKTQEAATMQPPTVSPKLAHDAAQKSDERAQLVEETYAWFWKQTGYKPGKILDPKDPQDAKMMPIWLRIFEQRRGLHGGRPATGRDHLAQEQAKGAGRRAEGVHHHHAQHRHPVKSTMHPRRMKDFREGAIQMARGAGSQFVLVYVGPDGQPQRRAFKTRDELDAEYAKISEQHDQYKYVASFDLAASSNAPVHDSFGVSAAEHAEVPPALPPATTSPSEGAPPTTSTSAETTPLPIVETPSAEKPKWAIGKIIAIAAGVVAVGGIVYVSTRKPSRSSSSRSSRARASTTTVLPRTTLVLPRGE